LLWSSGITCITVRSQLGSARFNLEEVVY